MRIMKCLLTYIFICTMAAPLVWAGPWDSGGASGISSVAEDESPTLGGDLDVGDYSVMLTASPTSDDTANGMIVTLTVDSGQSQAVGDCMHVDTDGELIQADADAIATMPCLCLALETGTGAKKVLLSGIIRNDDWTWTVGGLVYVSTTAGGLTQTPVSGSGDVSQAVGVALTADVISFNPGGFVLVEVQ